MEKSDMQFRFGSLCAIKIVFFSFMILDLILRLSADPADPTDPLCRNKESP